MKYNLLIYSDIVKHVFSKNKQKTLLLIFTSILSAIFEFTTFALLVPFISIFSNNKLLKNRLLENLVNHTSVYTISVFFILFIIISLTIRIFSASLINKYTNKVGVELCDELFSIIINQPYEYNIRNNTNYSISTINIKGGLVIYGVIQPVLNLLTTILVVFALLFSLLIASWQLVLIIIIFFFFFYFFYNFFFSKKMRYNSRTLSNSSNQSLKILNEAFSGLRYIILNNSFDYFSKKYHDSNSNYYNSQGSNMLISNLPKFLLEGIIMICVVVVILLYNISSNNGLSISTVILFAIAGQRLLPLIQQSFFYFNSIKGNYDALFDVWNVLNLKKTQKEIKTNINKNLIFNNEISFINVSFGYNDTFNILNNVTFKILKGQKVGIIGPSGSGKSTLIDLLLGLIIPTEGKIKIDDIRLDETYMQNWRRLIGSVPQNIVLNDQTVYENIAYGIPYKLIDFKQVEDVAKKANIYDDIIKLEKGFNTETGDKGLKLSGGQRQRIGIARALYANPKVLIFDEATSALDIITEKQIMETIYNLEFLTVIIITHRKETLYKADAVFQISPDRTLIKN